MNLEKELQNQFDLIDKGATMQINRDEDGFIRARVNPMPYLRSPMRQAEPQSLKQTIDEFPTVVGGLAAGATAATLGTIQDIAGFIYGAGKGMAAEEGQKMQTFLDTAEEISNKYGSGAVKGFIRDKAEEAGLDEQKLGILDEAMMAGEFAGIGGLAKGAVTAAPKMVSKGLDTVETLSDRAKQQLTEGGETLFAGAPIDDAVNKGFAAAGDVIAKFRAPTEKEPGIIAFHGSGADFDEFKLEKIGTGEGAQAYGYGLYFTDSEDIAKFYRDAVLFDQTMRGSVEMKYKGEPFKDLGDTAAAEAAPPSYTALKKLKDEMSRLTGSFSPSTKGSPDTPAAAAKKRLLAKFDADIDKYTKAGQADADVGRIELQDGGTLEELLLEDLQQQKQALLDIDPKDIEMATGKMYKVGLEPKPEDMLDYQGTFADQPKNVQDALKAIGYEVETNRVGQKNSKAEIDVAMKRPMPVVLDMVKKKIAEDASGKISELDVNKMSEFVAKGGDRILSERLLEQGVPGVKYRAAGSRGASVDAADAEMNYVIFDDKMIKILEKYGIVGPVAITGIAASQQEGESDGQSS